MYFNTQLFVGLWDVLQSLLPSLWAMSAVIWLVGPIVIIFVLVVTKLNQRYDPAKYLDYSDKLVKSSGIAEISSPEQRYFKTKTKKSEKKRSVFGLLILIAVILLAIRLTYLCFDFIMDKGLFSNIGFGLLYPLIIVVLLIFWFLVLLVVCIIVESIVLKLFNCIKARIMRRHSTVRIRKKRDLK